MTATTAQDASRGTSKNTSGRTNPGSVQTVGAGGGPRVPGDAGDAPLVEEDLLVEDVSIDGMCGVY